MDKANEGRRLTSEEVDVRVRQLMKELNMYKPHRKEMEDIVEFIKSEGENYLTFEEFKEVVKNALGKLQK